MNTQDYIALSILLPLVGTILIWMSGPRPNQREIVTIVTAILTFLCVLQVLPPVLAGENPTLVLTEILPGLPLAFVVEPLGMMFALIASFLWIVT
ncbi:MAG: monovalent cation/H+ antiporter subunit D family protein, partial [Pseudomonadota bacterium]|nr:monovalent cation/H+ antiporter subunit D family protein [Pseudomonadota bacterium]